MLLIEKTEVFIKRLHWSNREDRGINAVKLTSLHLFTGLLHKDFSPLAIMPADCESDIHVRFACTLCRFSRSHPLWYTTHYWSCIYRTVCTRKKYQ